jgi:regulatory protein
MKNIITDLKFSKRNPGRVLVYLDHRYAFTVNLLDAAGFSKGQELEAGVVARMKRKHADHSAYVCAIRYLSHRRRSRKEVDRYLSGRKGFARQTVAAVMTRLAEERYLNDKEFARLFIESRIRLRPRSCALLRHELAQKGIDDDVLDAVLNGIDDAHLAWRSIEGKLKQWDKLDRAGFKKRLIGHMQRRGFSLGVAMNAYRQALSQGNWDD